MLASGLPYLISESEVFVLLIRGQPFGCYHSLAQKLLMTSMHVIFKQETILEFGCVCSTISSVRNVI